MRPETEEDLAEALRGATAPLRVAGGDTRGGAGPAPVLETAGLSGVVLYEPAALTLVVRAGMPLAEVEVLLASERQRLAFEPWDGRGLLRRDGVPSIGGAVAANASGPRRIHSGACRDSLIGVRFVDGRGQVIRNGGRVMKNVTGYDLVKLMAGSRGRLGVVTELAFKLQPMPEAAATVLLPGLGAADAVPALAAALGSPYDVTGAAWLPGQGALLRIEGLAASVEYRAGRLLDLLARFGAPVPERDPERIAALWRAVRDAEPFHGRAGDVWRISVKPSDGAEVARRLGGEVVLDWGGGLVWALRPPGEDLRSRLAELPGHATRIRGAGPVPALPPEAPPLAAISEGLRRQFDPRGIFAPAIA